jgi:magnesium-transporting ATPase (P-type)
MLKVPYKYITITIMVLLGVFCILIIAAGMQNYKAIAATDPITEACSSGEAANSAYCKAKKTPASDSDNPITKTISKVITFFAFIGGVCAVIWAIYGGFRYVTSYGNPQKTAQARETVLYAIVGLIIIVAAYAIIAFIIKQITK